MEIWPAIDLLGGRCVRLQQGDYARETVFSDDPAAMAAEFVRQGAERLHLVDLDAARSGRPENLPAVRAILQAVEIPCELGGGVRDEASVKSLLNAGLSRLVVGTAALKRPDWFRRMCEEHPQRLCLGLDARDGFVATDGWLETSSTSATELVGQFADAPVAAVIYTDIARDGMLQGPNVAAMRAMQQATAFGVVASGGVSCAADVAALATTGVAGVIIGRALYDGGLSVRDALAAALGGVRRGPAAAPG